MHATLAVQASCSSEQEQACRAANAFVHALESGVQGNTLFHVPLPPRMD